MRSSFQLQQYDEGEYQTQPLGSSFNITTIKYKSPTLPLHFDKSYLPKNLCQTELLHTSQCLLNYNFKSNTKEEMCQLELSHFEICRRHRDLRILRGIHDWEIKHVRQLDKKNRELYKMGLGRKLQRLQNEYSRQTSSISGINKAKQLQSQVKQIKWRLDYIKTIKDT